MSSFWLTLKQQWTIKISSPFFLFWPWRPSWLEVGITGHNFERGPSKDHSTKVWLQLVEWFLRRRLKCEMLTDGRRTKSDDNSSHGLKARWAKKGIHSHMFYELRREVIVRVVDIGGIVEQHFLFITWYIFIKYLY